MDAVTFQFPNTTNSLDNQLHNYKLKPTRMKKIRLFLLALLPAFMLVSCDPKPGPDPVNPDDGPVPGALKGEFSVSPTKKIVFAKGNLQYQASTKTWRFADQQYECIGEGNANISATYDGWIDLFGFGTSGWDNGNLYYQPYNTEICGCNGCGYNYGPTDGNGAYDIDLTGDYANADWGVYNAIINGGNKPGLWKCLTYEEVRYLILDRPNATEYRFLTTINDINGLILLPDNWTAPAGCPDNMTQLTLSQWATLEDAGAVFLPAAGQRYDKEIRVLNNMGYYWTSTAIGGFIPDAAHGLYFIMENGDIAYYGRPTRYYGCSVRLVREVE